MRRALLALLVAPIVAGCATAPIAPVRGPSAPPAIGGFDPATPSAGRALIAGSGDRAAHRLGVLATGGRADSLVLVVYGDNRPGPALLTTPWGMGAMVDADPRDPASVGWAVLNLPVLLIQAVIPKLDGLRDLWSSKVTHLYHAGGEARVLKAIGREPDVSLIVNTGDLVENGKRGLNWRRFVERHAALRGRTPFVAAPGNHERLGDALGRSNWDAVMGAPADSMRYWYALDLPDSLARFVFLDSNLLADPRGTYPDSLTRRLAGEQLAWLDRALDSPARWNFVVLHHPLASAGQHEGEWMDESAGAEARRARLLGVLARHRVTAVLAGHEHLYQRTWLAPAAGHGFWQIVTGGGGAPLHRISRLEARDARREALPAGFRASRGAPRSIYHYCRVVLAAGGSPVLEARQVRGDGSSVVIERVDLGAGPRGGE